MKKVLSSVMMLFLAFGFVANTYADAQGKVLMRLGYSTPPDHPYGIFSEKFKELAEEYTKGEIQVKLFPSGQISSEDAAFKSLQLGTIDAYIITASTLSPHYPLMDAFSLPYAFESLEHMQKVLRSELADKFFNEFEKKTKVAVFTYGSLDVRDLYNTKRPINTFEDFAGLKYRVPKNEVMIETFKAFGAEPIPLAWSETPSALQTGTVDGGDNGTTVILQMKFFEIAKNLTVLEHFLAFSPLLVSERFLKKITPEQRLALEQAAREANIFIDTYNLEQLKRIRELLEENGMTITYPEKAKFIEAALKVQDHFATKKGSEFAELLEEIRKIKP